MGSSKSCILFPFMLHISRLFCAPLSKYFADYTFNNFEQVAIVSLVTAVFHPLWNYWYVYNLHLGYLGSAAAVSTARLVELVGIILVVSVSGMARERGFVFDRRAWSHWGPLLALSCPNLVMMTEWWASEIIIFLSGYIGNPEISIAVMSIYQNTNTIAFVLPKGFQVSGNIRVGNELGSNRATCAQNAGWITMFLGISVASVAGVTLHSLRSTWGYVFTDNKAVISELSDLLLCLSVYVVADGFQGALTGVIKALGKQHLGGPVVLFSYYVLAIPLSVYLAFQCQWGLLGLVVGTTIGTWSHASLYFYVILCTDWSAAALEASGQGRDSQVNVPYNHCV